MQGDACGHLGGFVAQAGQFVGEHLHHGRVHLDGSHERPCFGQSKGE